MASTNSLVAAQILPPHNPARSAKHAALLPTRRQCLLLLSSAAALKAAELPSRAQDIPLFGLRKSLRKVEEEAEEIVKEGIEAADKGIEATERGVVAAEKELETVLAFGGLAQAGVVAGAELLGVIIATSIVNGILGPEARKS
ncbi:uncharacterized protein LOC125199026 [Salvia hispanica]|uniref:uncharacterized protein LOC125199026 n=1 Tax=Salvia hispanica TaxID=49212 RepID=UPI002009476B|nr:uncharacterized protein LOC125199026 [Salvia hispanica]